MAEILVQWTSPNAARYAGEPSLRRRGDIREVGPNGNTWGRNEDLRKYVAERSAGWVQQTEPGPNHPDPDSWVPPPEPDWTVGFSDTYRVIQVQGISVPNMNKIKRRHLRAAVEGDPEFESPDPADRFVEEHRYAWRINIIELPAPKRIELRDTGFTTITKAQFVAASYHKGEGREFDDADPDGLGGLRLPGSVD